MRVSFTSSYVTTGYVKSFLMGYRYSIDRIYWCRDSSPFMDKVAYPNSGEDQRMWFYFIEKVSNASLPSPLFYFFPYQVFPFLSFLFQSNVPLGWRDGLGVEVLFGSSQGQLLGAT